MRLDPRLRLFTCGLTHNRSGSGTAACVRERRIPIFQSKIFYDQIAIEAFEVIEIPTHRSLSRSQHRDAADWAAFNGRSSGGPGTHMSIGIAPNRAPLNNGIRVRALTWIKARPAKE
jgi:hypothetical protein